LLISNEISEIFTLEDALAAMALYPEEKYETMVDVGKGY
jgi:hypothetical protein